MRLPSRRTLPGRPLRRSPGCCLLAAWTLAVGAAGAVAPARAEASGPPAWLEGRVHIPEGRAGVPRRVELRFRAAGRNTPEDEAVTRVGCPLDGTWWRCSVPPGVLDLELHAGGFAPRYYWGVSLEPGRIVDVGTAELRPGPSLVGRLTRRDGSTPAGPCQAEVQAAAPRSRGAGGDGLRDGQRRSWASLADERGFFQVTEVAPGAHLLSVTCPASAATVEVTVGPAVETRLSRPVLLDDLLSLDVRVDPPLDPAGRPWRLDVSAEDRASRPPATATLPADGRHVLAGLSPGRWQVQVLDRDGARFLRRTVALTRQTEPLRLQVPVVPVSGRVQLPGRPLRARLLFSHASGPLVALRSGEDGTFHGHLPSLPPPHDEGWTLDVEVAHPPHNIHHQLEHVPVRRPEGEARAWLDVELPPVSLRGLVVSEHGGPASGGLVLAAALDPPGATHSVVTDSEGVFELVGLPAGAYHLTAESLEGLAEEPRVQVEGPEQEVMLVLETAARLAGRVVSAEGPVPGAQIRAWLPPGVQRDTIHASADGAFSAKLPAGDGEVAVSVAAPGYALRMTRLPLAASGPVEIALDTAVGALIIDTPSPARGSAAVVVHERALESLEFLARWALDNGGAQAGGRLVVPRVEPGDYAVCLVPATELPALWSGAALPDRCAAGTLGPGGELVLSLAGL